MQEQNFPLQPPRLAENSRFLNRFEGACDAPTPEDTEKEANPEVQRRPEADLHAGTEAAPGPDDSGGAEGAVEGRCQGDVTAYSRCEIWIMFNVFFSWQSDEEATKKFLRKALDKAKSKLLKSGIEIEIQESARGEPGSPDIANTILERIRKSDAVISDVTIINGNQACPGGTGSQRPTINPNVALELGFAAASLDWDRVVLLMNTAFGGRDGKPAIPREVLPFDLGLKRVIPFSLSPKDDTDVDPDLNGVTEALVIQIKTMLFSEERTKDFDPIISALITLSIKHYKLPDAPIEAIYQQWYDEGEGYLLHAVQDDLFKSLDVDKKTVLVLLREMESKGLIVPDKTNLGHKTWYLSEKGLAVAKQRRLFPEPST